MAMISGLASAERTSGSPRGNRLAFALSKSRMKQGLASGGKVFSPPMVNGFGDDEPADEEWEHFGNVFGGMDYDSFGPEMDYAKEEPHANPDAPRPEDGRPDTLAKALRSRRMARGGRY